MKTLHGWIGLMIALVGMAHARAADGGAPAQLATPMVMSTRGFARTSVLNNSIGKEAITAYRYEVPYGLAAGWRLPYLGFSEGATGIIQLNGVLVTLETQPNTRIAVTFAGQQTVAVAPNTVVESDPVDCALQPGTTLLVWTYYRNQDPQGPLPFMTFGYVDRCDGCLVGDIGTLSVEKLGDDAVLRSNSAPPPLFAGVAALIRSYQPMFISGRPHPAFTGTLMSVGFIGDSINIATGDVGRATPDDPFPARGWNGRACGTDIPYVVFGQSGSNTGGFTGAQKTDLFKYIFGTGAGDARVNGLFDGYGINELRQQTKTKAPDKVWRNRLDAAGIAQRLGLPYLHTTLTPMAVNWLTFEPSMGDRDTRFAAFVAERKAFNEQVRHASNTIPGCVGFLDWGQAVETDAATNNNVWQPGVAMDGIHPNTEGYQRMSKVAVGALTEMRKRLQHPIRVACIGDSLTSGFKMEHPAQDAYPAQLARLLGAGYQVQAFAEPGRTALRKAARPLWKEQVFADAQAWQPDLVILCLGTNDCWPAIWQQFKGDYAGDLRDMVNLFRNLPSHPHCWVCLPPPLFIDNGEEQKKILADEVIPAIRAVAQQTGCGLIDWNSALQNKANLFMPDKVHPLPSGAAVMAQTVAQQLWENKR